MPKENAVGLDIRRTGGPRSQPKSQTTNRSVQLVDAFNEKNKRFENLEKRLTSAVTQLTLAEAAIAKLVLLSLLIESSSDPSLDDLVGTSRCIGSEFSESLRQRKLQFLIFQNADKWRRSKKSQWGIGHYPSHCATVQQVQPSNICVKLFPKFVFRCGPPKNFKWEIPQPIVRICSCVSAVVGRWQKTWYV